MSWPALVLVALTVGVALPSPSGEHTTSGYHAVHKHKGHRHKHQHKAKVRRPTPRATPVPHATPVGLPAPPGGAPAAPPAPVAPPAPTATPAPALPRRTGVDLNDAGEVYTLRPAYRQLAAGTVQFNANNFGMDDHNLTVKQAGKDLGTVFLPSQSSGTLELALPPGTYTLYCSLGDHEQRGMHYDISVD